MQHLTGRFSPCTSVLGNKSSVLRLVKVRSTLRTEVASRILLTDAIGTAHVIYGDTITRSEPLPLDVISGHASPWPRAKAQRVQSAPSLGRVAVRQRQTSQDKDVIWEWSAVAERNGYGT